MRAMSDVVSFVFIAQTTMLVITSVLLAYPVVAYARNVAHTQGLVLLSGAFFAITASYVVAIPLGMPVASGVLDLTASLLAAAGIWQFARPFVRIEGRDVTEPSVADATGGFEHAEDD